MQITQLDWLPWQQKCTNLGKDLKKINSSDAIWPTKLKLCRKVLSISLYKNTILIVVAKALWLLWQLKFSIDL